MADELKYPLINGFRHSFASVEAKFGTLIFKGFKSITYTRKRTRTMGRGPHPDPLFKTQGENEYTGEAEIYIVEWRLFKKSLGPGYGDVQFPVFVTYSQSGFETFTDELIGCTMDSTEGGGSQSPDPLVRKVDLAPIKVKFDGDEDLLVPLQGSDGA